MIYRRILQPNFSPQKIDKPDLDETDKAIDVLARTIWGEARGEPLRGQEAVAHVVLNRRNVARSRGRFW